MDWPGLFRAKASPKLCSFALPLYIPAQLARGHATLEWRKPPGQGCQKRIPHCQTAWQGREVFCLAIRVPRLAVAISQVFAVGHGWNINPFGTEPAKRHPDSPSGDCSRCFVCFQSKPAAQGLLADRYQHQHHVLKSARGGRPAEQQFPLFPKHPWYPDPRWACVPPSATLCLEPRSSGAALHTPLTSSKRLVLGPSR